jgi:hypothetical protein
LQLDDKKKGFQPYKEFFGIKKKNHHILKKKCQKLPHLNTLFMEFVNSKQDLKKSTTHAGQSSVNFNQTFRTK